MKGDNCLALTQGDATKKDLVELWSGRNTVRAYLEQRLPVFSPFPASWKKDARPCITFPQAPIRMAHQYHDYRGNNINDYGLKSSIFVKTAWLCSSGST
jgi:hypothetical protein